MEDFFCFILFCSVVLCWSNFNLGRHYLHTWVLLFTYVPTDKHVICFQSIHRRSAISPHSYPSSPGNTASISGVVRTPLGTPSASSQSRRTVMSSPCSLPLSPTHEKPTSSKSPQSDPGQLEVRRSPLGSNLYSSTDEEVPRSVRSRKKRGRRSPSSRRSPMSPDTHRIFLPISSPVVPPVTNPSPALKVRVANEQMDIISLCTI